jgi:hypothetical protein
MSQEHGNSPEETFALAESPTGAVARPKTAQKRKTTTRRTKNVLDEIAEQEQRLRKETRAISAKPGPDDASSNGAVAAKITAEYQTVQEKLNALDKLVAAEAGKSEALPTEPAANPVGAEASTEPPAGGKDAAGTPASSVDDFLKKQFFAILREGTPPAQAEKTSSAPSAVPEETKATPQTEIKTASTTADLKEPSQAGEPATAQAPEDHKDTKPLGTASPTPVEQPAPSTSTEKPSDAAGSDDSETAAKTQEAGTASDGTGNGDAAAEKIGEPIPPAKQPLSAVPDDASPAAKDSQGVIGRVRKKFSKAMSAETWGFWWEVFGFFCIGLSALVIILLLFQVMATMPDKSGKSEPSEASQASESSKGSAGPESRPKEGKHETAKPD